MSAEKLWQIPGPVPRAKLSPLYRISTLLAALGMVLLPVIYLGIIWAAGSWLWEYAQAGPAPSGKKGGSSRGNFAIYIVPLIVGAVVLLFMIKPLFSRRPKRVEPKQLRAQDEPELFAFIHEICDSVGAPRPKRVMVDLEVNASASLTHGLWSLFTRNLTLTIGLPLAGGLSARELGGVLAHEFGHFAQGTGMATTYAVRSVSFWFARVVYERDRWDELLEAWAKNSDWRIMIVLQCARLMVWLTRRVLWVLMVIGQFISSILMRQMEYDADHYEIQLSGSEAFIATARRLRVLGLGAHIAMERMEQSYSAKRLVDDLPGYMLHETDALPPETLTALADASAATTTGWLDTHPSDAQRIAAAERAAAPGILSTAAEGTALFRNFPALCREITLRHYRDVLEIVLSTVQIVPLEEVTAESERERQGGKSMEAIFHGMISPRTFIFVTPDCIEPVSDALIARNRAARTDPPEHLKITARELAEIQERDTIAAGVIALNSARIPVQAEPGWKFTSLHSADLHRHRAEWSLRMKDIDAQMVPVLAGFRERLATALSFLLSRPDCDPGLKEETTACLATLGCLEDQQENLNLLRSRVQDAGVVLESMERQTDGEAVYAVLQQATNVISTLVVRILGQTSKVPYPFPHAGGSIQFSSYLSADVKHPDPLLLNFLTGSTVLNRIYETYGRIMGRLAALTLEAEALMDAEETGSQPGA